jgi:hypothetical protein
MERQRGDGLVKKLLSCANHLSGPASHQKDTISAAFVLVDIGTIPDNVTFGAQRIIVFLTKNQ